MFDMALNAFLGNFPSRISFVNVTESARNCLRLLKALKGELYFLRSVRLFLTGDKKEPIFNACFYFNNIFYFNLALYYLVSIERSSIFKQNYSFQLQICVSMCDLLMDTRHLRVNKPTFW